MPALRILELNIHPRKLDIALYAQDNPQKLRVIKI